MWTILSATSRHKTTQCQRLKERPKILLGRVEEATVISYEQVHARSLALRIVLPH